MPSPYDFTDAERNTIAQSLQTCAALLHCDDDDTLDQELELSVLRFKVLGRIALEAGR